MKSHYMLDRYTAELDATALAAAAPSAYAAAPSVDLSKRYVFYPTHTVIEALREAGWAPVAAREQRIVSPDRKGFQKHLIRFHRRDEIGRTVLHDSRLELLLTNSHDGASAFHVETGVFRQVCSNGLIVCDGQNESVSIRHTRRTVDEIIEVSRSIARDSDRVGGRIGEFISRPLTQDERTDFATRALVLRYDSLQESPVYPEKLLVPSRREDVGSSLWQTFNVVQERMLRGTRTDGRKMIHDGRNRRAGVRALSGLDSQLKLNRQLWELAVSYLPASYLN